MRHVVVVTNRSNTALIKSVAVPKTMQVVYVEQQEKGQVQAVIALEHVCKGPVLLLNASDYYADACIQPFLKSATKDILLGAVRTSAYFPGGYLKMDGKGSVQAIIEKPKQGTEPSDVVRILVDYIPDISLLVAAAKEHGGNPSSGYEEALTTLIAHGSTATPMITDKDNWKAIKYPWHILDLTDQYLSELKGQQIDPSVVIKPHVIIEGNVVIESGVKIFEGTKIVGPAFIGKNTIIGNNNIIRSSVIGRDCVTGFNTDITRSAIGNNCWFHTNYVGDSVIGNNVSMGSGTVLANLRLDDGIIPSTVKEEKIDTGRNKLGAMIGDNVRIGVNVSTMPGIKIGRDSFIAAGIVVTQDIPQGSFVRPLSVGFVIKPNTKTASTSREGFRKGL